MAGHRWYGSTYNQYEICRWEGYDEAACEPAADLELYGPNTYSISVQCRAQGVNSQHKLTT